MRVVLDTNVLLSAVWKPEGNEARVVRMGVERRRYEICVSGDVMAEYHDVLFRAKFAAYHEAARVMLAEIAARSVMVEPAERLAVARDPDDDRLLECATAAGAAYLVTGNLRDYPAAYRGTRVVNARRFLEELVEEPLLDEGDHVADQPVEDESA